jgi:hypothetical protein
MSTERPDTREPLSVPLFAYSFTNEACKQAKRDDERPGSGDADPTLYYGLHFPVLIALIVSSPLTWAKVRAGLSVFTRAANRKPQPWFWGQGGDC